MRFVLYDQQKKYSFEVIDDDDHVAFRSGDYPTEAAATDAINDAIDSLRDPAKYRVSGSGVDLVGEDGSVLMQGVVADGQTVEEFKEARVEDASDQDDFDVTVETGRPKFGGGGLPKAPTRSEMAGAYDFAIRTGSSTAGVAEYGTAAPYYFVYQDAGGRGVLYSRDFPSESRRSAGVRSLLRYAKEKYVERWEADGGYYFRVVSPQGFELGRSPKFATEAERRAAVDYYLGTAQDQKSAYAKPTRGQRLRSQEYQLDRVSASGQAGFEDYEHENKRRYFVYNDASGQALLHSQGYRGEKARDTGRRSVVKNGANPSRYRVKELKGEYYIVLLAGNNQEIGRSRGFATEAEAERQRDYLVSGFTAEASRMGIQLAGAAGAESTTRNFQINRKEESTMPPEPSYTPNESREQDNYLVCSAYEDRIGDSRHEKHDDVIVFQHSNSLYYFATLDANGGIALRSEGYPTEGARATGLKSVLRNREKRGRFKIVEQRNLYYTTLTAQNDQEIGRSCPKKSEDEAMALWPALGAAALRAQQAREADAAALAAEPEPTPEPAPAPVTVASAGPNDGRRQDNYLACKEYESRIGDAAAKHPKHGDVIVFQHDNGLYYFATLDASDKIALRSEGYPTTGARDTGLKSVLRNREKRQRFKTEEKMGKHFTVLYAQNGQEIGRSCPKASAEEADLIMPGLSAAALALAAAAAAPAPEPIVEPAPVVEPEPAPAPEPADKEDDYLACKEYRGRKVNDSKNRVSLFKHANGQFYFAILDAEGKVRLRSEGFRNGRDRDKELSGALRFIDDESKYERITRGKYHINVLYDDTGREVGRSCAEKEPVPFIPVAAVAAAAAAPLAAAGAGAVIVENAPPPPPPPPPVVKKEPVAPPPPVADKGGCAWWMWLLAALLLLGLAWYFLRGCDTPDPAVETAAVTAPVETPPPPPPAPEPAPEPVVEATPEPAPAPAPPPPPRPAPITSGECGGIAVGAEYNDAGIPLMPLGNYGGIAGDVQDYLRGGAQGSRSFSMSNVAFLAPGNDLAIEPCSVGDVDRLAAVLRNNPGAEVTISVPSERNCRTLQRLLAYRGIDRSRITIAPSSANEIVVTP